ncbi:MAG: IPT/TIG domain-containing protein [Planctomycetes bacterium]|nr:IPT/TIG domain-containing protein [Planctomycetota bacterium]
MRTWFIALCLAVFSSVAAAETVLVEEGDVWYFYRGWTAPFEDWMATDFDPAAEDWESGPTGIGYSDDDDATLLEDMQNNYWSVFLRIDFEVPEALEGAVWILRVRYDDGFVAYIDADEVARRNLTGVPPLFDEAASPDHEITTVTGFDEAIALDGLVLAPGPHVLAVEVHNATIDSSDLSFSAELAGSPFTVTAVVPAFGPVEGGETVSILGSGFDAEDAPAVRFGGTPSPSVTVESPTELRAVVPAGAAIGTVDVEVEDSRGLVVLAGGYRYSGATAVGLIFDGGDYALAANYGDLIDEGTFEVWFLRTGGGFFQSPILLTVESEAGGTDAFRIDVRNTRIRARTGEGDAASTLTANVTVNADEWYHLAYVFSPAGRTLYLNGAPVASDETAVTLPEGTRLRLGASFAGGTWFTGRIESARVWEVARSAYEIRRDMYARIEDGEGLASSWPLAEGAGQVPEDIGPAGHDLVLGDSIAIEDTDPTWTDFEDFPSFAVTSIEPASGPLGGGGDVRILGTGFSPARPPVVRFGANESPSVEVVSTWELEVVVPAGDAYGPVDVIVEAPAGSATIPAGYTYVPADVRAFAREGDIWYYTFGPVAPPEDWMLPGFDPAAEDWSSGPSGFGYGDDDDATDVSAMLDQYATLFVRIDWQMADGGDLIDYLVLRVRYDDGIVAYLNGTEIVRRNVDGQPPAFDELASGLHEITVGAGMFDEEIDILGFKGSLRPGENVLAIEVHNATLDSTDLSISAELLYAGGEAPGARFIRGDVDRSGNLTITDAVRLLYAIAGGGALPCEEAGDVDDDGKLALGDGILLLTYLFSGGTAPPAPFPSPGPDLDGDGLTCEE